MNSLAILPLILMLVGSAPILNHSRATAQIAPRVEREVMALLDEYMSAWNRKDLDAWERTFHFPHYRLASGRMAVLDKPGMQDAARVWGGVGSDWHHSQWDRRVIIHASADKIHVDTTFSRFRADGSKIGSYDSLYILTRENGRWGVKLRSSFAQ
jgi:hypothetical protein